MPYHVDESKAPCSIYRNGSPDLQMYQLQFRDKLDNLNVNWIFSCAGFVD